MKRFIVLFLLALSAQVLSAEGNLFKVTASGSTLTVSTTAENHDYPAAGLKINTPGVSISSGCSQEKNGSCIFGVSKENPANLVLTGPAGKIKMTLCLDGLASLSCQNYTATLTLANLAYITNYTGSTPYVSLCRLDSQGEFISCGDAGGMSVLSVSNGLGGIAINAKAKIAYLSESGNGPKNQAYQCTIDGQGLFSQCHTVKITPSYSATFGLLAFNPVNELVYLVNDFTAANTIIACPVNAGNLIGNCGFTDASEITPIPTQIALNKAADLAFIGNAGQPTVTACTVQNAGMKMGNCVIKEGDNNKVSFALPTGVAFNGDESLLYVADRGKSAVYACDPTPNGGKKFFNSCFVAVDGLSHIWSITIDSNSKTAYVTTYAKTFVCPIAKDGTFDTCSLSAEAHGAVAVALGQ